MKQPYLCHITAPNGQYTQKEIIGITETKKFLRDAGARFANDDFSFLENESLIITNDLGFIFEIELLFIPDYVEVDGVRYIPVGAYMKKYDFTRKAVYIQMSKGLIKNIKHENRLYIEDVKRRKNGRSS